MSDLEIVEVNPPDGSYGTIGARYTPSVRWHQVRDILETDLTARFEAWNLATGEKILDSPSLEGRQFLPGACQGYYTWSRDSFVMPDADVRIKCTLYAERPEYLDGLPPRQVASKEWTMHPIKPPPPPEETVVLTINRPVPEEGGTTDPPAGVYYLKRGTTVTITAIPNPGWYFDYWSYNLELSRANPLTLTLDKSYTVTPHFTTEYRPPPTVAPPAPPVVKYGDVIITSMLIGGAILLLTCTALSSE